MRKVIFFHASRDFVVKYHQRKLMFLWLLILLTVSCFQLLAWYEIETCVGHGLSQSILIDEIIDIVSWISVKIVSEQYIIS